MPKSYFESLGNSFDSSSKQIFRDILGKCSYFIMKNVCCVYSLESPHQSNSNEYTSFIEDRKDIPKLSNSHKLNRFFET